MSANGRSSHKAPPDSHEYMVHLYVFHVLFRLAAHDIFFTSSAFPPSVSTLSLNQYVLRFGQSDDYDLLLLVVDLQQTFFRRIAVEK